jgi:cholesterol transport system auxiliary component
MAKLMRIFLLFSIVLLSGCSFMGSVKSTQMNTYVINKVPAVAYRPSNKVIFVLPVESNPLYNTSDMIYSTCRYKIDKFAKNRWAETPPRMLHALIVQALQDSHHYKAVVSSSLSSSQQFILQTEIVKLQQNFMGTCRSNVQFVLRARLLSSSNRIVAAREFSVFEPAVPTPYGGVQAANRAVAEVVGRVVGFVTRY